MAYPAIPSGERPFFEKIISDSVESGYLRKPSEYDSSGMVRVGGHSYFCCCIGGSGRGDGDAAVILTIVLCVFAFFIGLFYTGQSINSAAQAHRDLSYAQHKFTDITPDIRPPETYYPPPSEFSAPPVYNPSYPPSMSYQPPTSYSNPPVSGFPLHTSTPSPYDTTEITQPLYPSLEPYTPAPSYPSAPMTSPLDDLYQDAAVLLEGRRNERILAAVSQGLMTAGAGLLTVALAISLIVEPEILTVGLGLSGAGLGVAGVCLWIGKSCGLLKYEQQEAADRIIHALGKA